MTRIDTLYFALLCLIAAAGIFAFDTTQELGVAGGVPYVLLVLLGLCARHKRVVLGLAAIATLLTVVGFLISAPGSKTDTVVINRILAIIAIWSVAGSVVVVLRQRRQLEELLDRDALTGVFSRNYMLSSLRREIDAWNRTNNPLSLIMLDVDHFKRINDQYGHQAGDRVLRSIAQTCSGVLRSTDWICRYGGEEFAIILPQANLASAGSIAERIRLAVESSSFSLGHDDVSVTVSLGLAEASARFADAETLLSAADRALYRAKEQGRNRIDTAEENQASSPAFC